MPILWDQPVFKIPDFAIQAPVDPTFAPVDPITPGVFTPADSLATPRTPELLEPAVQADTFYGAPPVESQSDFLSDEVPALPSPSQVIDRWLDSKVYDLYRREFIIERQFPLQVSYYGPNSFHSIMIGLDNSLKGIVFELHKTKKEEEVIKYFAVLPKLRGNWFFSFIYI